MKKAEMKTTRICSGVYQVAVNGRVFKIEEVGVSEGYSKTIWNVSEVKDGKTGRPFDSGSTLREAKRWAAICAGVLDTKED